MAAMVGTRMPSMASSKASLLRSSATNSSAVVAVSSAPKSAPAMKAGLLAGAPLNDRLDFRAMGDRLAQGQDGVFHLGRHGVSCRRPVKTISTARPPGFRWTMVDMTAQD